MPDAMSALRELVELEDIRLRLKKELPPKRGEVWDDYSQRIAPLQALQADYERRRPLAWQQARAVTEHITPAYTCANAGTSACTQHCGDPERCWGNAGVPVLPGQQDAGAMWDRFVTYHARRIGIEPDKLVNLIGGAAGLRQDFLDAQSAGVSVRSEQSLGAHPPMDPTP